MGVSPNLALLDAEEITATVQRALDEDIGSGDLTAGLLHGDLASARVICREEAILCGRPWFDRVFQQLDPDVSIDWLHRDGERIGPGQVVCQLSGPDRVLVTGERTALNFLQTLSGVATVTYQYALAIKGTGARLLDTRKTIPGLRKAQKYAVSCGGGHNHRVGLYDAVLIKENHIQAAGSVCRALELACARVGPDILVEIEVEDMEQLRQAITCGAKRVLLDNFPLQLLPAAVAEAGAGVETEVSGNVDLDTIRAVAECGVDYISVGALTKHVRATDYSLRIVST